MAETTNSTIKAAAYTSGGTERERVDLPADLFDGTINMGKGKGSPEGWVAVVKPGRVMFELEGVTPEIGRKAMALAAAKIGVKSKFVTREEAHTDAS